MSSRENVLTMAGNPFLSRSEGATDVYIIRHADALPGPKTVIPGGTYDDQPLSDLGQQQAAALGAYWATTAFTAIYATPLRRTQETAQPLASALNLSIHIEPDLREVELAGFMSEFADGTSPEEHAKVLRRRNAEIIRLVTTAGMWSAIPGAEASDLFRARVVAAVDRVAAQHRGERIALFTHGGVINIFLAAVLGIEKDFFFPTPNTGLNLVRVRDGRRVLMGINDIAHLKVAGLLRDG